VRCSFTSLILCCINLLLLLFFGATQSFNFRLHVTFSLSARAGIIFRLGANSFQRLEVPLLFLGKTTGLTLNPQSLFFRATARFFEPLAFCLGLTASFLLSL